jgi:phosphatidylglycerol:prolipoprotein diacylglycerol transferase
VRPLLAYWVDTLNPFVVRIWGDFGIRWYGLAYVGGFLASAWLLRRYALAGRSLLPAPKIADFMVAMVIGVVVGGRLGAFFLYDYWKDLGHDPFALFRVWKGGMASHGGIAGVILATIWFSRSQKIPFLHLWDLVATTAPAGLFFGRVANFINGELWGKPTDVPWAVIFPRSADAGMAPVPRHPSQLYEAGLEGLFLFAYLQWRFWRTDAARAHPGRLAGEFMILYAAVRIAGEVFREPDASLILGLSRGTFYSLFMIAFGLALWLRPAAPLPAPAGTPVRPPSPGG